LVLDDFAVALFLDCGPLDRVRAFPFPHLASLPLEGHSKYRVDKFEVKGRNITTRKFFNKTRGEIASENSFVGNRQSVDFIS